MSSHLAKPYTHYAYLSGPNGMREPTGLLMLGAAGLKTRRALLHQLLANGELLSALPIPVQNMAELRNHLKEVGK